MNRIISYLEDKYHPLTVILYGSYADGSNNQNSDFDALLVAANGDKYHDVSTVEGVQLDVFVYPLSEIDGQIDYNEFIQILDGKVIFDTDSIGCRLMSKVSEQLNSASQKSVHDIQDEIEWCKKMLSRVKREDAEGYFRWHWLLIDSLEIACDILHQPYRGPKKKHSMAKRKQSVYV